MMNIYQTGLYGQLHSKGIFRSCSRVVVLDGTDVKALVQLRIKTIPFLNVGAAEVDWGPIWHHDQEDMEGETLGLLLDALKEEYCLKRKLELRIRPRSTLSADFDERMEPIYISHGFKKKPTARPYHTVYIDLTKTLETIRAEFHQKWRNQLNVAERAGLEHEYGSSVECFDRFYTIYKAMWKTKKFPTGVRLPIIRELQKQLPQNEKFIVTIVRDDKMDIGASVCSALGDTMRYFLGATSPNQRNESRPGYLLQWLHIIKSKELGMRWYDLGGYDDNNPDIARFKKRTNGLQIVYPGQFEALPNQSPSRTYLFMENTYRKIRRIVTGR
jgi:lipid II:glycine glycyltransferase (peptidoglycan interpeptide bridge formation enzyme)